MLLTALMLSANVAIQADDLVIACRIPQRLSHAIVSVTAMEKYSQVGQCGWLRHGDLVEPTGEVHDGAAV